MNFHGGIPKKYNKDQLIDFSVNIPPLGAPIGLDEILKKGISILGQYPDINSQNTCKCVGSYLGLDHSKVIVGNGATELIYLIAKSFSNKNVLIIEPTFTEYRRALLANGCSVFEVLLPINDSESIAVSSVLKVIREKAIDLLVICNPNNPTGCLFSLEWVEEILSKSNVSLMIDESFIEFVDEINFNIWQKKLNAFSEKYRIFVMRSMTKSYCVPGLRIAYGFGESSWIQMLNALKEPWSVNTFAQISIPFLLEQEVYLNKLRVWCSQSKKELIQGLSTIKKLSVIEGKANFILVRIKSPFHNGFLEKMIDKGIYIRPCVDFRGLGEEYFRVAVRTESENQWLIKKMSEVLK